MLSSNTKTRKLILEGNLYKVFLVISLPIMVSNIIQALYEVIDMFYVGKLGAMALAALSLTGPINFLIMVLAMGMATGSISLMSKCIGEGAFSKFSRYAGQLVFLNFILSLFVTIFILIFIDFILDFLVVRGELKELAKSYLYVTICAIPVMFLSISIIYILNSQGETIISMMIVLIANIINFILDPILMFTFNLGIAGAAWATLFSKLTTVFSYLFLTYRLNRGLKLGLKDITPDITMIRNILSLGLPSAFGQMMISISFLIFNYFVIRISPKFLAAYGLTNSIIAFLLLPGMSIGTGIISIVGQNLGAKNIARVGDALKKGFFVSLVVLFTVNSFIIFFREVIIRVFTDDLEVINYANNYLLLASIGAVGYGLQQGFFGGLIGAGLTNLVMILVCIRLWIIRLPAVIVFQYFGIMEDSLGYAFIISNYVTFIILLCLTFTKYWEKPQ
ncbi:MATE family efflux transporter [Candidatus Borreliella tachyglossi]|uniref:Multidrug-efflux transporter n=1 Tax=Candidatus Borreliella tachyglossi TaxID=1964448 RepID=A0A2S1LX12_9SPIR|nr:MATE family efflux transporter [Candidatus Borreliella tachyglossi]AWG42847.1 MATE family efflux transporter [Candidatus Borreliella tachyglossi]